MHFGGLTGVLHNVDRYDTIVSKGCGVLRVKESRDELLLKLFFDMLYISAFTFGGGFVIVSLMKKKFVDEYHWLDEEEMLDLTAMAQSSPGAIAVNAAILVGWRVAGFAGMVTAVIGTILPPMAVITLVSVFYDLFAANPYVAMVLKGMQAGVAAVVLDVALGLGTQVVKSRSALRILGMTAAFIAVYFFDWNVVWVLIIAAGIGVISAVRNRKKEAEK